MATADANGRIRVTADALQASPIIDIDCELLGNEQSFIAHLEDLDKRSDREYQRILTNNNRNSDRIRPKDLEDAMSYIFRVKFRGTNLDWNKYESNGHHATDATGDVPVETVVENGVLRDLGYDTEMDFFQKDEHGRRYLRAIVNRYFEIVRARADASKKT